MSDDRLPEYPTSDPRSFGYGVARSALDAAASVVPGGSYAIGALVEHFVAAPLQKRRDEWFERVGKGLLELQDRLSGFDPSTLSGNEEFISAVFDATQSAMKTANEDKLVSLRNGILNVAAGVTLDEILRGTFFGLIDRFSPLHIQVLSLLADPSGSPEMVSASQNVIAGAQYNSLRAAIPESVATEPVMSRVLADLAREGLADTGSLKAMGTPAVLLAKRSTAAGDAFLAFVKSPLD